MGLKKNIELSNGVRLTYHRIVSMNVVTNQQIVIEVGSYVSKDKRDEEAACLKALKNGVMDASCDVYINTMYFAVPYDPELSITQAYEMLKTSEVLGDDNVDNEFYGSKDVFE